ncbi:ABC transporter permease [Sellimonas catena]|uniref:Efflux ABC transporter permease n=1 Tax=Sellimonas catena TaxID=2994035 RepID=A0A9W6FE63_9FIRM|nr:ABC transporter permease [Sellimonas catena]GLG04271.1 efflux ABC transporter permease [Sellimonas catena]
MNDILFGNNNKAVIKKLANRSFRSNKMRNVIAVIAIALTTFLFTAVLTIGMGASGTLEYSMAKLMGSSADALVQGLSEEQFQQLKQNAMFEKVGCWVPVDIMTNTNRRVAEVDYADQAQLEIRMLTPRTGSAPQKVNEVLVSANILKDLNIEEKIGAEIPIELKARQSGQIYHFDMVVSGIYDTPNEKSESVIVSKAFLEENPEMMSDITQGRIGCGIYSADVVMRDNYMVKDRISELVRNIGGNPDDINADNAVRVALNPIISGDSGLMMWLVASVFGILFMFCGYLLIYNVFEIAVTNDIRQYGLLRTVGTTSQQIKRLVNRQALYLFLIGTPFGLLFGILLGRSILPVALQIFAVDYSGGNIEVGTLPYWGIIVGAILFSGLTVYISTRKSVKKASRVSPIEAIRYVEQDTVSIKRKKTNAGAVIPRMAKANLQRNKRRTVFIVISLTLSIVLLNSVFIFSGSFDEDAYITKQTRSDFMVYSPSIQAAFGNDFGHNSAVPERAVQEIEQQSGVMNEVYLYRNTFEDDHISCDWGTPYVVDNTYKNSQMLPEHINQGVYQTRNKRNRAALAADNHPLGNVFGFSENFLDRVDIIEGETDLSVLKEKLWNENNVILVAKYNDRGNLAGGSENPNYYGLSVGDTIQFYENGIPTEKFTVIAKVAGTDSEVDLTGGGSNISRMIEGPGIYMAENKFKEIYEMPTLYGFLFDVEEQYQQDMENHLAQDTDVAYTSILTMKATVSGVKNVVLLIGGVIGAVFALVGLINFINLVMTNIITRRHEFATMQSIGMTNRQLRKMIISESFSYVLLAGIVGTLAAGALGMTLVRAFVENGPTSLMMTFQMTLLPALIMLALFLVLAFIVPVVALRLFNNRSVVERLRVNE